MKRIQSTFVFLLMISAACGKQDVSTDHAAASVIEAIPSENWKSLAERRIFFAHKSVGQNILDGIDDLDQANPEINVRLVETRSKADLAAPALAHARTGVNGDPLGKITAFKEAIDGGLGETVDIAFLKLCFVDITAKTDVSTLFAEYKKTMASLKVEYPQLTLVHFTVPLTVVQTGPKAWVKKWLGRPVYGFEENMVRGQFNEMVRREYEGKEPVFDLAAWQSTMPDGTRKQFIANGQVHFELSNEYASDGGHLNERGRRWVAAQLLALLASLPDSFISD